MDQERFWKYFRFFLKSIGIGFVFILILVFMISQEWLGALPSIEDIKNPQKSISSIVFTEDLQEMGKYYVENRTELNYSNLPQHTVNALIATEDFRFREHPGVDLLGISTAFFRTFFLAKKSGASTITQQLAKNLFHDSERKNIFVRSIQKVKEWYIAIQLERNFSKDEIIALYFNTVSFLHNSYGLKEAAKTYFNKDVAHLKIEESAVLVGMLKGPGIYNPKSNPENAKQRRNVVLHQMSKYGYISENEADSLSNLPLKIDYKLTSHNTGLAPYLREEIRKDLEDILDEVSKPDGGSYDIYRDGLRIYTTINSKMQENAEKAVEEHMIFLQKAFLKEWGNRDPYKYGDKKNPDLVINILKEMPDYKALENSGNSQEEILKKLEKTKKPMRVYTHYGDRDTQMSIVDSIKHYKKILHAGLCAIDPSSGQIKAWVGGIQFNHFKLDHVKESTKRQVGSTIKPFLYALAIEQGETPCSEVVYNAPNIPGFESWDPRGSKNFIDGQMVSLKDGLQVSDNRVAAQIIKKYGPNALIDFSKSLGIKADFEAVPSISLGTTDVSVYEMIGAYSPFMNKGIYTKPYYIDRIEDKDGNVIYQNQRISKEVMSPRTAILMNLMLQNVTMGKGTASRLRGSYGLKMEIAAKTGTTQSNSDGWFIGSTPSLLCAVWVGADDPSISFASTALGQGASSALPIWAKFVNKSYNESSLNLQRKKTFVSESDSTYKFEMDCNFTEPTKSVEEIFDDE